MKQKSDRKEGTGSVENRKEELHEIIRHNLKLLRIECGFTQIHLAEVLCCSRSAYTYKENGKTEPSIFDLITLGRVYNIPITTFLEPINGLETSAKRPNKGIKPHPAPEKIGELTVEERRFIAIHRTSDNSNGMRQIEQQTQSAVEYGNRKKRLAG